MGSAEQLPGFAMPGTAGATKTRRGGHDLGKGQWPKNNSTIAVAINASYRRYRPNEGPRLLPITLLPRDDSPMYIRDEILIPREASGDGKMHVEYLLGSKDSKAARISIDAAHIGQYVSEREYEWWCEKKAAERQAERDAKDREERAAVAKQRERGILLRNGVLHGLEPFGTEEVGLAAAVAGGKKKRGRKPKSQNKAARGQPSISNPTAAAAFTLTPVPGETEIESNDEEAIHRQLQENETGEESEQPLSYSGRADSAISSGVGESDRSAGLEPPRKRQRTFSPWEGQSQQTQPGSSSTSMPDYRPEKSAVPCLRQMSSSMSGEQPAFGEETSGRGSPAAYVADKTSTQREVKGGLASTQSTASLMPSSAPGTELRLPNGNLKPDSIPRTSSPLAQIVSERAEAKASTSSRKPPTSSRVKGPRAPQLNAPLSTSSRTVSVPSAPSVDSQSSPNQSISLSLSSLEKTKTHNPKSKPKTNEPAPLTSLPLGPVPLPATPGAGGGIGGEDPEYDVKRLEGTRIVYDSVTRRDERQFRVRWKGKWPPGQNPTWEPEQNIPKDMARRYLLTEAAGMGMDGAGDVREAAVSSSNSKRGPVSAQDEIERHKRQRVKQASVADLKTIHQVGKKVPEVEVKKLRAAEDDDGDEDDAFIVTEEEQPVRPEMCRRPSLGWEMAMGRRFGQGMTG